MCKFLLSNNDKFSELNTEAARKYEIAEEFMSVRFDKPFDIC